MARTAALAVLIVTGSGGGLKGGCRVRNGRCRVGFWEEGKSEYRRMVFLF